MSATWKYKFYGTLFAALLSIYLLLPTYLGLKEKREALKNAGQDEPWYFKLLPADELNLGLDLRGGLYLELDVAMEEALSHQVNSLISDIKHYVLKDDLANTPIENVGNGFIRVELAMDRQDAFKAALVDTMGNQAVGVESAPRELLFAVQADAEAARKKALDAVKAVPGFKGDVSVIQDKKFIAVTYKDEEEQKALETALSDPSLASDFSPGAPASLLYLKVGGEYLAKMQRDIIEQAANAVRNRIDRYGVAEANVSRQSGGRLGGDRLVVELPGEKNPDNIISIIRRTGKLEFRLVDEALSSAELRKMIDGKKAELKIDNVYEGDALAKLNAVLKADLPEQTEIVFSLKRDPMTKKILNSQPYLLNKDAQVTGDMLDNAKVETQNNMPYVSMSFNKSGARAFGTLTEKNIGKQLAIVLDSVVMSAPVIRSAIMGGQAQIELGYGKFDALQKEAQDLVLILREGALPASLSVASKNVIGPSLGRDAIDAGIKSVLVSSLAIVVFMLLYYRTGGLVANVALILNISLLFGILCLFQASISLPGLAGIALTNGMAVDANVIIFERMREERYLGHGLMQVIENGYQHALSAIIDGHVTIFISGLVLFEFGSGPIKGFATTLMIGIVCTLFTSIIVTKTIFEWMVEGRKVKQLAF
jgi:protein-export membrane protein SecD